MKARSIYLITKAIISNREIPMSKGQSFTLVIVLQIVKDSSAPAFQQETKSV